MWLFFRCFHLVWSICSFCFMRIAIVDIYCIRCRCFVRQYAPPLPVYPPLSSFCYDYFSCLINVCAGFFFLCWLLNFYVHIHWAMACININNLNFVSAHLVGISSVHIYPLYELPSLCDIFFCFVSKIVFFFCFISFNSRNLRCFFLLDRISVATTMHWHWPWHWCSTQISNQRATKTVHILKKKLHSELCTECEFWITNKNLLILSHESERCTEHIEYICIKIALTATKDSKRKKRRKKNCRRQTEVKRKERIECQRRRKSTNKTTIECID